MACTWLTLDAQVPCAHTRGGWPTGCCYSSTSPAHLVHIPALPHLVPYPWEHCRGPEVPGMSVAS